MVEMRRLAPDIFYRTDLCPVRGVLSGLTGKWSLLVLMHLSFGTHRFSELLRGVPDISQRMLTKTLRHLEREGLLTRKATPSIPPRVEYSLTKQGKTFLQAFQPLLDWTILQTKAVEQNRATYDMRKTGSGDMQMRKAS